VQSKIVAIIPTRGRIFSRTIESVHSEMYGYGGSNNIHLTYDKSIPDAQNHLVGLALADGADWIWMVEEDMVVPAGCLSAMLATGIIVVTAKYKIRGGTWSHVLDSAGKLVCSGVGCLLVHRTVYASLGEPYFRTNVSWCYEPRLGLCRNYLETRPYGGHDVDFYGRITALGISGVVVDVRCAHLKVETWGRQGSNDGCHKVVEI